LYLLKIAERKTKPIRERFGNLQPRNKIILLLVPICVLDLILILINYSAYANSDASWFGLNDHKVFLSFDGKSAFYDGTKLTMIVDNNESNSRKTLSIYGLDSKIKSQDINASDLAGEMHTIRMNDRLNFTVVDPLGEPKQVKVWIPNLKPGSYQGWVYISSKGNNSIPITISTGPKVSIALLWVVIGILTSIIFWEIIKYIAQVKKVEEDKAPEISADIKKIEGKNLTPEEKKNKIAKIRRDHIKPKLDDYLERQLASKTFLKVATIDIGTIGFGISVGFLALLSQGYVTAIRVITPIDIAALLGLGLGIGSLREFVNKSS
jgi:hypothetical protein